MKKYIYREGDLCNLTWDLTTLIVISSSMNQSVSSYNDEKYGCAYKTDHILYQQNNVLKTEKGQDNAHYFYIDTNISSTLSFNDYKYIAIDYEIIGEDSQIANCEVTVNGEYIINSNENTNRTVAKIEIPASRQNSYDPEIAIGSSSRTTNNETKQLKVYNIWLETEPEPEKFYNLTKSFLLSLIEKIKKELLKKVDKEDKKGLSTNDYTDDDKSKVNQIDAINSNIENIEEITSKIITDSDGTKFLSDDGTYKEISSGPLGIDGKPIKEYGVRWDKSSNPTLTRVGDAVGLVANAGVDSTVVQNDFDNIYPWSERKQCNLSVDGEVLAYKGDPDFKTDGTNGMVMVETPIFYQKYVETDEYIEYWISNGELDGYRLNPRFVKKDGTILDKIYTGAYEAVEGDTSTILASKAGVPPKDNISLTNARTYARNIGTGWGLTDIAYRSDILFYLFTIEFATLDSQSIIMGNVQNDSVASTGLTDNIVASSGSVTSNTAGNTPFIYRGEENIWGNIFELIDGCNIQDASIYVCTNPEDYESDKFTSPYVKVGYNFMNKGANNVFGYIIKMGYDNEHPYCNLPYSYDYDGSSSTYYCDFCYLSSGNKVLKAGGAIWSNYGETDAGITCWYADGYSSDYGSSIGCRLSYKPV